MPRSKLCDLGLISGSQEGDKFYLLTQLGLSEKYQQRHTVYG